MDKERPKIELEGFKIIFELLQQPESDRFRLVKKALGISHSFDPTAIRRTIVAADAIAKNADKPMSRAERIMFASTLEYEVGATYLERVYGYFVIWQKEQIEKEHKRIDDANKVKKEQLSLRKKREQMERARQKQQNEKEQKIIDDANRAIKEQINLHEKTEQKERARQKHLDSLNKIAGQLRNRIINPETYYRPYSQTSTWQWGKQDLRFVPTVWFDIMTPRQDDDKLLERDFPGFQYLKVHLKSSPYWEHYENLKATADKLEADISNALDTIKTNHKRYIDIDNYRDGLLDFCMDHVWSPKTKLTQDEMGDEYALSTEDFAQLEERYRTLTKYVPDYKKRLNEAEKLLQQLWDDWDPDDIEPRIENGTCPKCFSKTLQDVKE